MSKVIDILKDPSFSYKRPWFYNHPLALRCELGIGNQQYMENALHRANEIYAILFKGQPDAFFFHHSIYDWDDDTQDIHPRAVLRFERQMLSFSLEAQKKHRHIVVRDLPFDREDNPDIIRINRIICYPDSTYEPHAQIHNQINGNAYPLIHFVSEKHECIFSIYDDRGCDIVFFTPKKFQEFFPLLQPYFLEYDLDLMSQRLQQCKAP